MLSTDFEDPFMSHQYVIQSVKLVKEPPGNLWDLWFGNRFFQERTESIDLPFKTFAVDERHVQATKKYYAGYASFNSFNATFFEDSNQNTMKAFVNWQRLMCDDTSDSTAGTYYPADNYQAKMVLNLLNHQNAVTSTATFHGVFPTQITNISLTGAEVTRIQVQVAFSINSVTWSN
jgi:hypothetical protein